MKPKECTSCIPKMQRSGILTFAIPLPTAVLAGAVPSEIWREYQEARLAYDRYSATVIAAAHEHDRSTFGRAKNVQSLDDQIGSPDYPAISSDAQRTESDSAPVAN